MLLAVTDSKRCDLVHASQTSSPLHILRMDPPGLTSLRTLRMVVPGSPLKMWELLSIASDLRQPLVEAVQVLSVVSEALERYLHGPNPNIEFSQIVNARNDAQYLLLSLEPCTEGPASGPGGS